MIKTLKTRTAAIAAIGVIGLGGAGAAVAATSGTPTPLTGSITEKASTAAVATYPGSTLVGIRSEPDGGYVADVRTSDGTTVLVELDKDLKVTGTRDARPGGPGGPGGHRGPGGFGPGFDTAALAKTLGVTETQLQSALEATRGSKQDRKGDRAAAIAKALGAPTSDVQAVLDAQRGGDRGPRGPRGDRSALVTALAEKTGKSEPAVTAALEALHEDRHDAEATALAKQLGIDASKVKTALEAARPQRP